MNFEASWMKRVLLATAAGVIAGSLLAPGLTRAALVPSCSSGDRVYGITSAGALTEHEYCTSSGQEGAQVSRPITGEGWWLGGAVFFGGTDNSTGAGARVFYQVSPAGALLRFELDGDLRMTPGTPIGAAFGDWRQYASLFAYGDYIYGLDGQGRLLRWEFWPGPADENGEGPDTVRQGLAPGSHLIDALGDDPAAVALVDPATPSTVTSFAGDSSWAAGGVDGSVDPQTLSRVWGGYPLTLYGLTGGGQIARLTATPGQDIASWLATPLEGPGYVRGFAGQAWSATKTRPWPYEWQWPEPQVLPGDRQP